MQAKLLHWINRLEALSLRERIMVVVGVPVVLAVAGEFLVFGPAATKSAEARKQIELRQGELKAFGEALATQATVAGTPGLTLTKLRTLPAEMVFAPSMVKPADTAAARPRAVAGSAPRAAP